MNAFRRLVLTNRCWAATLLCAALLLKIIVPAGFMPVATGKTLSIALCTGTGPATLTVHLPGDPGKSDHHRSAAEQPCAFSALAGQALTPTDPILLEAALLFAFVLALLSSKLRLGKPAAYLRPPLRGPPAII